MKGINKMMDSVSVTGRRGSPTRVISFTGGKGGTGKTTTVLNIGMALSRLGRNVLILDADLGLANVNVMLGIEPVYTLWDVFEGRKTLEQVIIQGPDSISIIPAASGIESILTLSTEQRLMLISAVEELGARYDYLLIDTQAGIGSEVMYFNTAATEIVCVINEEPTSLTDAYALIKILSRTYGEKSLSVIANNVPEEFSGKKSFAKLFRAAERFLHIDLKYLGHVPSDKLVPESIKSQRALLELYPSSAAGLAFASLGRKIDEDFFRCRLKGGMQFFFKQLLEMSAHGG